jgi:serine/threonine protein phosphatase PrpC
VAKFAEENLVNELKKLQSYQERNYKKSLEEVFLKIDDLMLHRISLKKPTPSNYGDDIQSDPHDYTEAGCTSNVILVTKDKIYCANSGDSRAVMCENG